MYRVFFKANKRGSRDQMLNIWTRMNLYFVYFYHVKGMYRIGLHQNDLFRYHSLIICIYLILLHRKSTYVFNADIMFLTIKE